MSVKYKIELDENTLIMLAELTGKSYSEVTKSENSIKHALYDYICQQYNEVKEAKDLDRCIVGWVDDELVDGKPMDRNEKGEITNFFVASYHTNLFEAIKKAQGDFLKHPDHVKENREIIVVSERDYGNKDVYRPLWTSRDDEKCQKAVFDNSPEGKRRKDEMFRL